MNAKRYFQDYAQAQAFYAAQEGDCSIGQVRADLRAALGNWIVKFEEKAPAIQHDGKRLVVTLANGMQATRKTANRYAAAVIGQDKAGKWSILSAHWDAASAQAAIAKHQAWQFVNFNYRDKLAGAPVLVTA